MSVRETWIWFGGITDLKELPGEVVWFNTPERRTSSWRVPDQEGNAWKSMVWRDQKRWNLMWGSCVRGGLHSWFRKLAGPHEGTGNAFGGNRSESRVAVWVGTQAETSPLAVGLWASYLTCLLVFLSIKREIIIPLLYTTVVREKWDKAHTELSTAPRKEKRFNIC